MRRLFRGLKDRELYCPGCKTLSCKDGVCHGSIIRKAVDWLHSPEGLSTYPLPSRLYAGIGSRDTPPAILAKMQEVAAALKARGWTLRSGNARGADQAFEASSTPTDQIFLPYLSPHAPQRASETAWLRSQGFTADFDSPSLPHQYGQSRTDAEAIASQHHPSWPRLGSLVRGIMARNANQVLGPALNDPVTASILYAPVSSSGVPQGGTSQAIRHLESLGIPYHNYALHPNTSADALVKALEDLLPPPIATPSTAPAPSTKPRLYDPSLSTFNTIGTHLSNFTQASIRHGDFTFPSVEHAYQALESTDPSIHARFASLPGPDPLKYGRPAKYLARQLNLKRLSDPEALALMATLLERKFTDNPSMRAALLATGQRPIAEDASFADFWGTGHPRPYNHLGRLLMELRARLSPPIP